MDDASIKRRISIPLLLMTETKNIKGMSMNVSQRNVLNVKSASAGSVQCW